MNIMKKGWWEAFSGSKFSSVITIISCFILSTYALTLDQAYEAAKHLTADVKDRKLAVEVANE